jgi:hypothetical protein
MISKPILIDIPNPPPIIVVVETVAKKRKEPVQIIPQFQCGNIDNSSHSLQQQQQQQDDS